MKMIVLLYAVCFFDKELPNVFMCTHGTDGTFITLKECQDATHKLHARLSKEKDVRFDSRCVDIQVAR